MRIFNLLNSFFVNRGKQFVTYYDGDDELYARGDMFVTMCRNFTGGEHHAFRHWVCLVYQYNTCYFVLHKLKIAFCKIALEWNWIGIGFGLGLELDWIGTWIGNHHQNVCWSKWHRAEVGLRLGVGLLLLQLGCQPVALCAVWGKVSRCCFVVGGEGDQLMPL